MTFFKLLIHRSSWILGTLLLFLGSVIYFQFHMVSQTEKISHQLIETSLSEPSIMAENIAHSLEVIGAKEGNLSEKLLNDSVLRDAVESSMRVLKTPAIGYIYLLYPDGETLRYLADASSGDERARPGQRFEAFDEEWMESIRRGEVHNIYSSQFASIGVTHIRPIKVDGKVQAVLVFDLMMQRVEAIDDMSAELQQMMKITIIVLTLIGVIVILSAIRFYFINSKLHTDPLTQVHNRNFLEDLRASYNLLDFHIISVDIDHFKKINDTFGHDAGDVILHNVAQIILSHLRKRRDFVIRMGGEEFLLLIRPDTSAPFDTLSVAKRIHNAIYNSDMLLPNGEEIHVSVSMGVNVKTKNAASFDDALKQSDIALYHAKHNGRNRIEQYEERRIDQQVGLMKLIDVKESFDEDRLVPFLQPIYHSDNCALSHYEMLARIRTRDGKIITPNYFLPTIHSTLLEQRLTKRIIQSANQIITQSPDTTLSLNISVGELNDNSILDILLHEISDSVATQMCLELLETDMADDFVQLGMRVQELKEKGYRIAIDDFGTGYSNFINIAQLNIDYLKIDGSLIRQVESNVRTATIVEAIQVFSEKLGIMTVAEFVSSDEILHCIQSIGINYVQGYVLGKPAPVDEYLPNIAF
ncbi:EAL domain-containing protein [Sulfuricurvum sp.]|uniref:EAL domain-containing protein n=1 Tax=Sulfuricurvum sp. TaxID=2025608 RepID=UPI002E328A7D|nr:EAL domain-containing protein [Sulfuricurvum sp.]HEX5329901.1 EAL domain-containing protein [Sulfuricurvum sp.]